MIKIRKSNERGHIKSDWLNTYHTFSFGEYYDPANMHFGNLRVINEDYIKSSSGFPFHSHKDMEILTYIISGELEHKDSLGNTSKITRGEIQLMRAGSGITHSEYNPSDDKEVHLLQIWIIPDQKDLEPLYQQKQFNLANNQNKLTLIASKNGENNSFTIAADAKIYSASIKESELSYLLSPNRKIWLQIVAGNLTINNILATAGDGVAISDEASLVINGDGEFIMFDLG